MSRTNVSIDTRLRIGQLAKIGLSATYNVVKATLTENDEIRRYSSRIENILPTELVVAWPIHRGVLVPVAVGQNVVLYTLYKGTPHQLHSEISGKMERPVPVLHIARSADWERLQVRSHVRLDITIVPSEAALIKSQNGFSQDLGSHLSAIWSAIRRFSDQPPTDRPIGSAGRLPNSDVSQREQIAMVPISMIVQNLSAGGMMSTSKRQVEVGDLVRVVIPLHKGRVNIDAVAQVVWADTDETKGMPIYRAGCQFLGLGMREQDAITRFIFAKEAEMRRAGMV